MKFLGRKKQSTLKPLEIPMPKVKPPRRERDNLLVIIKPEVPMNLHLLDLVKKDISRQLNEGNVIMLPSGIGIEVVMLNGKDAPGVKVVTEEELKEKYSGKEQEK